ncbi:HPP family protein [Paenibacillus alkalitolerans]|uniref:HPP family protein n=1 Tax=Paenibacillus alkalitolerans TaxID=2799335 RepID=UPI001F44EB65|nr:HPP family protein [Paenibacillus alkalitolerans]
MSLSSYFGKMRGGGRSPLKAVPLNALHGFIGGVISIGALAWLTHNTGSLWLMAPFGASCVLAFGLWDAPLSQPRNIVGGHVVSTFVGLLFYHLFGNGIWAVALAVGAAIAAMILTRTTHPPAGADPIVVMLEGSAWSFLMFPVLAGAFVIAALALLINNLDKNRKYPTFWY